MIPNLLLRLNAVVVAFMVNSIYTNNQLNQICSVDGYHLVQARFGRENHMLCLKFEKIGSSALACNRAALLLDPEAPETAHQLHNITMAFGFPVEAPSTGSAEGYIGDDHNFYGVLHLGGRTLHADPYGNDEPKKSSSFNNDYIEAPMRPRRDQAHVQLDVQYGPNFRFRLEDHKPVTGIAPSRICELLLLADKEFFVKDGKSSMNHAVRKMVHAVAQVDAVFRNTDFNEDGVPDNIGFAVKYIIVLQSDETNQRVFGDSAKSQIVDGRKYLLQFARLRRLSEVCLGIAFSGHAFQNMTLGLSFTSLGGGMGSAAGGICDRRAYGRSFNTLVLAHATSEYTERVPERIVVLTLAHELGHSFGAHHDENFPTMECSGYLMGSQSTDLDNSTEFSVCSKRLISATLNSMSYCLVDEDMPYCGNGIVEKGEACDCGHPSRCGERDPCCTPRAGSAWLYEEGTLFKEGCSVSPAALCHPSQGLCCNSQCKHANLTEHGIECEKADRKCTCSVMNAQCRCGLGGRCLPDGSCHAAECALQGLKECQCYGKGPGGAVSEARRCGVCCSLGARPGRCVGAEQAAREQLDNGARLLHEWPDIEDYQGPNVTIQLCQKEVCRKLLVRAWVPGSPCVSQGAVGICALGGICKPAYLMPRTNVYPTIMPHMLVKAQPRASTASATVATAAVLLILNAPAIVYSVSRRINNTV